MEICKRFFVDDIDKSYFIDYHFKIKKSDLGNNSMKELLDEVKVEYFIPPIYYVITDFKQDKRNENYNFKAGYQHTFFTLSRVY